MQSIARCKLRVLRSIAVEKGFGLRHLIGIAAAALLAVSPARAQGFDVTVDGLGKLTTTVGIATRIQPDCTVLGVFPPGGGAIPYTVWALTWFGVGPLPQNRLVHVGIKVSHPSGPPDFYNSDSTFESGTESRCLRQTITKEGAPGIHLFQFYINAVEIGRYSVTVLPRR